MADNPKPSKPQKTEKPFNYTDVPKPPATKPVRTKEEKTTGKS